MTNCAHFMQDYCWCLGGRITASISHSGWNGLLSMPGMAACPKVVQKPLTFLFGQPTKSSSSLVMVAHWILSLELLPGASNLCSMADGHQKTGRMGSASVSVSEVFCFFGFVFGLQDYLFHPSIGLYICAIFQACRITCVSIKVLWPTASQVFS